MASDGTKAFKHKLSLQVDFNGSGHLFCGRAAERIDERLVFLPAVVAGNMLRFLILLGELYSRAHYFGMVDVGVALAGLKGCVLLQNQWDDPLPYDRNEYRQTARVSALGLKDAPEETARNLLMPLFNAISQGHLNPFPKKPEAQ